MTTTDATDATDATDDLIISADDHMDLHVMPPGLFVDRVPSALRDQVPVVIDTADGPCWSVDGGVVGPSGRKAKGLLSADAHGFRPGVAADGTVVHELCKTAGPRCYRQISRYLRRSKISARGLQMEDWFQ